MAGILPIAYHNDKLYIMLSRETVDIESRDMGKWSDFGGKRDKGECLKETAIREGLEETMGILGSRKDIENLINNSLIKNFRVNNYTTYVIQIRYVKELPKQFRTDYLDTLKNRLHLVTEHNGLYEKDMLKWVELKDIKKFIPKLRPWYKPMLTTIYDYFNKMG